MVLPSEFYGYRRQDGRIGIRNRLAVIAAMDNSNPVARRIASLVRDAVAITVPYGRGQTGLDKERHDGALEAIGCSPNFGAVLVVSLESKSASSLAERISRSGKPVEWLDIQGCGGTLKTTERGVRMAVSMLNKITAQQREPVDISELCIGSECGGSDTTSGIITNPLLGRVGDTVIDAGGTWFLSETEEVVGAEGTLVERAADPETAARMAKVVKRMEDQAVYQGTRVWPMGDDNIEGGLTTLEEKALGNVHKGGTRALNEVIEYGCRPSRKGLVFIDAPAPGSENITALSLAGAQLIMFSTGKGNPIGSPVAPVIKITGNSYTASHFADNIDVDVSDVMRGECSWDDAVARLASYMLDVANGRLTKSELLHDEEVVISPIDVGFLQRYKG